MKDLFRKVTEEKENITVDGVPGYNEKAQFTNGKVICEASWVVCELLNPEEREEGLKQISQLVSITSGMKYETWGILYALEGIYRLKQNAMLEKAVEPDDLETLRKVLDWRTFVDTEKDFALIGKPTNYYGVAFGIARYRELLEWEPVHYSGILLDHLLDHISRYSGAYGYMDETRGAGRYDRYSILIPAEITELVLSTSWQEPELIRNMLDRSAHICLLMAGARGTGFSYGRSIGAYGDTAALQILSTAAALGGIFTKDEEKLARGYCCRLVHNFVDFWYDEDMQSVNLWEKGRRTDGYRNKNRILGENLSLSIQVIIAEEQWERIGQTLKEEPENWEALADRTNRARLIRFTDEPLPRSLFIYRDGDNVWSLPVINGGDEYLDRDPYMPVPRCNGLLEAVPDCSHGAWIPCLHMANGTVLMPLGYAEDTCITENDGAVCKVHISQKGMVLAGKRPAQKENGVCIKTEYTFMPGKIVREDNITISQALIGEIRSVTLQCEMLKGEAEAEGYAKRRDVTNEVECLDTPHGRCSSAVLYEQSSIPKDGIFHLKWTYRY